MGIDHTGVRIESEKQEIIARLRHCISGYKDGIPDEIKHSVSPDSGWKVQKLWFQVVVDCLADIIRKFYDGEIFIPAALFNEIFAYKRKLTSGSNPLKYRLTTQADIDEATEMIEKVIAELEKS